MGTTRASTLCILAAAASLAARAEKIATQGWVERVVAAAVQTNGLDEASVRAIMEARENNDELYDDDEGLYYYVLTRTADGRYYNRRVDVRSAARTELGAFQGAWVTRSTVPGLRAGDALGFASSGGAVVLRNASNEFAYAEVARAVGTDFAWTEATLTNAVAWGGGAVGRYEIALKSADGGAAGLEPYQMFAEAWMAATGEATTNAYGGVDAAVHWATNAIRREARTVLGFEAK